MYVVYGQKYIKSNKGPFGEVKHCTNCGLDYAENYIIVRNFFHIYYIPLIPCGYTIYRICPACGYGYEVTNKEEKKAVKAMMKEQGNTNQLLSYRAVYHKSTKTYDLFMDDANKNETITLLSGVSKQDYRNRIDALYTKKVPVEKVD